MKFFGAPSAARRRYCQATAIPDSWVGWVGETGSIDIGIIVQ
jgi:hypothetical protein